MLRLNTAIAPSSSPNSLGLLGLDVAGWPNGRRVFDDVATIALRAVAGATLGFVVPTFTADKPAGEVDFGITGGGTDLAAKGTEHYLSVFPYLGTPYSGFSNPSTTPCRSHRSAMDHHQLDQVKRVCHPRHRRGRRRGHRACAGVARRVRDRDPAVRHRVDGTHVAVRARHTRGGRCTRPCSPAWRVGATRCECGAAPATRVNRRGGGRAGRRGPSCAPRGGVTRSHGEPAAQRRPHPKSLRTPIIGSSTSPLCSCPDHARGQSPRPTTWTPWPGGSLISGSPVNHLDHLSVKSAR